MDKVVSVRAQTPLAEVLKTCRETNFTRFPVWQEDQTGRRIVGVISLRTFLYETDYDPLRPAGSCVKPALFLREDLRLEDALRRMQGNGQRLAIVLGRDQREIGIVSLEDILKVIFGEVSL